MIFEGIGIDLHFLFEGHSHSREVAEIFQQHHHADQRVLSERSTRLGLFRVQENTRVVTDYGEQSMGNSRVDALTFQVTHGSKARHNLIRVWRHSNDLSVADESKCDYVTFRALSRDNGTGEARVLCEARPIEFSHRHKSLWVDAGLVYEVPECDIEVLVERPALKQNVTVRFVYQSQDDAAIPTPFPGVPLSDDGLSYRDDASNFEVGSQADRQLRQYIDAFIARRNLASGGFRIAGQSNNVDGGEDARIAGSLSAPATQTSNTSSAAGSALLNPDLFGPDLPRRAASMNPETAPDHAVAQSGAGPSCRNFQLPGDASFFAPTSPRGWTGAWNRITSIANHIAPSRAASLPPAAPSAQTGSDPLQPVPALAPLSEEAVMGASANESRVQDSMDGNNAQAIESQDMDVGGQDIRHGLEQLLDGIDSILGDAIINNLNSHGTINSYGLPAPSGVIGEATAIRNDMDMGSSSAPEQVAVAQGDQTSRAIVDGTAAQHQNTSSDASPEQTAARTLLTISDTLEGQRTATDRPPVSAAQDVDMEDGEAASDGIRPDTHGDTSAEEVSQMDNNISMTDAMQDDFTIVSCTRRTDAQAGGAAPSTATDHEDNESVADSDVPLASRTGLLTVEALQAIQELALVPSRAGSARGPPSDASGTIALRQRGRHSQSPALSASSRSHRSFNPTT